MTATYQIIEQALDWLSEHWAEQPELSELATHVGLSEFHLQRLFTRWVGVSPKKFLSVLTLSQAKQRLEAGESVLGAALDSGLSGPGRLHDLFITCEAMTPGEYKRQAGGVTIRWGWHDGPFGETLLMLTERGLCGLSFLDSRGRQACFADMADRWPKAHLVEDQKATAICMKRIFAESGGHPATRTTAPLRLLLKGTEFQTKVWRALLSLPPASLTTYGDLAQQLGMKPGAARAVGTAVGMNPISWLIPCHRVIRASGALGGYRWGLPRKIAMMGWEAAQLEKQRAA